MFPPIADPNRPVEDQAVREMGLRLMESCQQVNMYGSTWTEGMWAEIHHAEKLGIPVLTDQKQLGKAATPPRQETSEVMAGHGKRIKRTPPVASPGKLRGIYGTAPRKKRLQID